LQNFQNYSTDIIIVGAGPAGATASLFLCKSGVKHIIADKAKFPRDKICGDALSGKVMNVLKKLNLNYAQEIYNNTENFIGSYGVKFAAPNGKCIDIPFKKDLEAHKNAAGFISKRINFDNFLFSKIDEEFATILQNHQLKKIEKVSDGFHLTFQFDGILVNIFSKLIISAEGDRSLVRKQFTTYKLDDNHYCAGLRAYYKGVTDFHSKNFIELHFLPELSPGYFWIFPLPNGEANVGVGLLSKTVSQKKINLRKAMQLAIENNPTIKNRFINATQIGETKGWGLPLGSKKQTICGDGFMLTGDAASLIDPFTGEGIANAMISGIYAAQQAVKCVEQNNYSSQFMQEYETIVFKNLWSELKLSHKIQRLSKHAWLFNYLINKCEKNETLRDTITVMFDDVDLRNKLKKPSFYFKLLFNKAQK